MGQIAYEFRVEMSRALYESYLVVLSSGECATQREAIERARRSPAPNWFTSARNAAYVLSKIFNGEETGLRDTDKIRKFQHLAAAVQEYRESCDAWPGLLNACREVVLMPAPEYYICHSTAKQIILKERKRRREEIARRWVK